MDCRDSALFTGVDEASCENMLRCFSAYEQRFSAGQTILTCGQQQDMIGVLLSGSAVLLRLHADGNHTVLENMDEGSVFGEELAFTGFRDGSALIECREDCRVIFMRYDQITKRCENACACHSQVVTNLFQLLSKKSLHLSRRIEVLACRSIREKLLCFFEQLADEHGMADRVTFHGYLPGDRRDALLARAAVQLCASDAEGWGQVVIDAAAHGVPTIARDVPGLRDSIQPGRTGWLVPDSDDPAFVVARLGDTLADVLATTPDPGSRIARSEACRAWADHFDWSRMRADAREITTQLLGRVPTPPEHHHPRDARVAV